jgi:hypothetical protein
VALVFGLAIAEHPRQMAKRLLMLPALDRSEIAGEFQEHALLRHQLLRAGGTTRGRLDILEEITDVDSQRTSDLVEAPRRDTVDSGLVLVGLLIGDSDQLGHLLLGQAEHDPSLADTQADVAVDIERATSATDAPCRDFAGKLIHRFI